MKKSIVMPLAITAIIVIASTVFAFCGQTAPNIRQMIFADVLLVLTVALVTMAVGLGRSLETTLYAYKNIGFMGGILFTTVLIAVLCFSFIPRFSQGNVSPEEVYRTVVEFPRQFSFYAVFVIIALSALLGVSNIALIRHEGFHLHNLLSIVFAGIYIGATVAIYFIADVLKKGTAGTNTGLAYMLLDTGLPMFLLLMLCYFECIIVGFCLTAYIAVKQKPAFNKDYIIILGCSIDKRGGLLPLLKGRVNKAVRFAWEQEIATGKPAKYIPSGGKGENEVMSEGSAMELYLLTKGVETYEVFPEKESRNTLENMKFSKKIIDSLMPNATVAFATTNYHILRSGILAREAGFDAEGIAGDTKWYFWPNGFIREFFGILALKKKAHITVACVVFVLTVALVLTGYFFLVPK